MSMPYGRFNIGMMGRRGMMGERPMGSEEPVVLGIRQTNPPR
jgi:hypothetical protein